MPSALICALTERHRLPAVGADTIDAFLSSAAGDPEAALVLFAGDPIRWPEASYVAAILPELIKAFAGEVHSSTWLRTSHSTTASLRPWDGASRQALVLTPIGVRSRYSSSRLVLSFQLT